MSTTDTTTHTNTHAIDQAMAESNTYEVIRKRLQDHGQQLQQATQQLNQARLAEFKRDAMSVVGRLRVHTDNHCQARDIVQVGAYLLFGYNVFIGLKQETAIHDVFMLYQLREEQGEYSLQTINSQDSFLAYPSFVADFRELYTYYKQARLIQLQVKESKLLAAFQIGDRLDDIRVFRWTIDNEGQLRYIDNRGERDIALPQPHDFSWTSTGREHTVQGRHPHINILDTIFVETIGGDLTVKIENNTQTGQGIYSEPVQEASQSLDDASIAYACLGGLILLKIRPYREEIVRYLVYNKLTQTVKRIDLIGQSCVQLPEDHGIIFPGGIYLQNGESKHFSENMRGMRFKRRIISPNGEDVLYLFYAPEEGRYALFAYNLIDKSLQNPLFGHGYALDESGRMVIFTADNQEPTRVHPMQIWSTPFTSAEYASRQPASNSFYARIGNPELVRGISELYGVTHSINSKTISIQHYQQLIETSKGLFDRYYWLESHDTQAIQQALRAIHQTASLVLDEFAKVESIRAQAKQALQQAQSEQKRLLDSLLPDSWDKAEQYVDALHTIQQQRGHLLSIREYRYMDTAQIDQLETTLAEQQTNLGTQTIAFLASETALRPYQQRLNELEQTLQQAERLSELQTVLEQQEKMATDLDLLSALMGNIKVTDATLRTQVTDELAALYAKLNQLRARAQQRRKTLGSAEAMAQFGVQFKLFGQSITSALNLATTPEQCDEQLGRLLVQLEELESQFTEHETFLDDIMRQREEVYASFEAHKQTLISQRQRRAQHLQTAAQRILASIQRRSQQFTHADEFNAFFAADALAMKVRDIIKQLNALEESVKAADLAKQFKAYQEQGLRVLRDKRDIYEGDGQIIKLGPHHRFSVTKQALDLSILPRQGQLYLHLNGTDFFSPIMDEDLNALQPYWEQDFVSETPQFYRAEYLAGQMLQACSQGELPALLEQQHDREALMQQVRLFATPRYQEGYEKGIHDHDAMCLLSALLPLQANVGLLRFDPPARALACLFWSQNQQDKITQTWRTQAISAKTMQRLFQHTQAMQMLQENISQALHTFATQHAFDDAQDSLLIQRAAHYLAEELAQPSMQLSTSHYAEQLISQLKQHLHQAKALNDFETTLAQLTNPLSQAYHFASTWLRAMLNAPSQQNKPHNAHYQHYIPEAAAWLCSPALNRHIMQIDTEVVVENLMGEHPLIQKQCLTVSLDRFLMRYQYHQEHVVPHYQRYQQLRSHIANRERQALRLETFKPRPLASFVRNQLISEVYLPLIGDNLAKQIGTVNENKHTDQMGLLMLISPPGYGKTTLMEYLANRLGLIFMKINCPSLGHNVTALDPAKAPDAAAAEELNKLNLALEMSNNVMLYLDDIQHTHPEFLQKFISLSDGTRRIDGVWRGKTRTYDMRGKRFCIIMAGNPYTESGEIFRIPDMLANRADVYNLGEVLGDKEAVFALSYLENCLTANPVLAPLANRDLQDIYAFIDLAQGKDINTSTLTHAYSHAEITEIVEIFQKLFVIQAIVLKVNQQYIASAAQNDAYRTEPPFKLQGSYRNMNKMAEKISPVMTEAELMQMIADHYQGEAQLLTSGAEENLLKLAELRGNMTADQQVRWQTIKQTFRQQHLPTQDATKVGMEIANKLGELAAHFQQAQVHETADRQLASHALLELNQHLGELKARLLS